MPRILVVDDEPAILSTLKLGLEKVGLEVSTASSATTGLRSIREAVPDVAILDVMLPDGNGLDVLRKIREIDDQLPVVFITGSDDSDTAIEAMKQGALDYLIKPVGMTDVREVVKRAVEVRTLTEKQVEMNSAGSSADRQAIIGKCPAMQEVYKAIGIVASQDVTVLIRGESGTGKELVARALYQHGERTRGTFLAVNCAAIPENLLESELFGHEKGAFTGADRKRIGKFEQCCGGTLFLDEIGDMSPVLQSKLLRVLQEKQFERVGGNETISTDVRVIAATHRNLEQMVAEGDFRADLYYRLNGFTIHLPPLRERGGDIDLLIEYFRRAISSELDKPGIVIAPESMQLLRNYPWPGNIRELQNAIRQGLLKTTGKVLIPDFLPGFVRKSAAYRIGATAEGNGDLSRIIEEKVSAGTEQLYDEVIGHVENHLVSRILAHTRGDKEEAIRRLGVNPTVLRSHAALDLLNLSGIEQNNRNGSMIKAGMTMEQIERQAIEQALEETKGCRKDAAEMLGISVRTMQRKIKEHDLDV
jgi:two-component system nitrogen regulation response regulator GlnG